MATPKAQRNQDVGLRGGDPVLAQLDAAPYDDEELTSGDEDALRKALSEPGVPWAEAEPELRAD